MDDKDESEIKGTSTPFDHVRSQIEFFKSISALTRETVAPDTVHATSRIKADPALKTR